MLMLRQMRRDAAGLAVLVLLPVGLFVWLWSSPGSAAAPVVPTGASFNLTVARSRSVVAAASIAQRLTASGYPAFTRTISQGGAHQVIVGPYVSIDEVERAQRRLRGQGFGARMLVDESVRTAPDAGNLATVDHGGAGPHLVLVGAAGRLSLVFELDSAPKHAKVAASAGSLVEVEIGPVSRPPSSQVWNGPPSAALVNQIAIDAVERDGQQYLHARVALSTPVNSLVRTVGTRVYVDLWDGTPAPSEQPVTRPSTHVASLSPSSGKDEAVAPPVDERLTPGEYQELVAPAVARLRAIEPFVSAAVVSPSADVLTALAGTLSDLHAVLGAMEPPQESAADHAALVKNAESLLLIVRAATPSPLPPTPPQP